VEWILILLKSILTGSTGFAGFFSPAARRPFGRRSLYPDNPVNPVYSLSFYETESNQLLFFIRKYRYTLSLINSKMAFLDNNFSPEPSVSTA
jgi:hypothetical protein